MQLFSSDKRLQEIFFQNQTPTPAPELNGRPPKARKGLTAEVAYIQTRKNDC